MASKRAIKRRVCERKQDFPTLGSAIRVSKKMRGKYGESFDVYKCKYCGEFHIGHRTQSTRAKLKAQRA